jgi:hypothetical protein
MRESSIERSLTLVILPGSDKVTKSWLTLSNLKESSKQRKTIFPPKGSTCIGALWDFTITIMCLPNKLNPWNILLVHKFEKIFHQQSNVLGSQVQHPQPTSLLGFTYFFPLNKAFSFLFNIFPFPV